MLLWESSSDKQSLNDRTMNRSMSKRDTGMVLQCPLCLKDTLLKMYLGLSVPEEGTQDPTL